jgi:exonuclease III
VCESLIQKNAGFAIIRSNAIPPAGRGHASCGLAIVLSAPAKRAWKDASSYVARYGHRVMAVRLKLRDSEDKALDILVVCAYAPTSDKPAAEREEFLSHLAACVESRRDHEMVLVGGDFNASIGVRTAALGEERHSHCNILGPHGIARRSESGVALLDLMTEHRLCAVMSFFQKKRYLTWALPGTDVGYQIDHWLVSKADYKRISDAARRPCTALQSDHTPIWVKIYLHKRTMQPFARRELSTARLVRHDTTQLQNEQTKHKFIKDVIMAHRELLSLPPLPPSPPPTSNSAPSLPGATSNLQLSPPPRPTSSSNPPAMPPFPPPFLLSPICPNSPPLRLPSPSLPALPAPIAPSSSLPAGETSYSVLEACVRRSADLHLSRRRPRPTPSWFAAREHVLLPLVKLRNDALDACRLRHNRSTRATREETRAALQRAVREAKRAWLNERIEILATDCKHPGVYWQAIQELKTGLNQSRPMVPMQFRARDGKLCEGDAENAEVLQAHFGGVYNRKTDVDPSAVKLVRQRECMRELAVEPGRAEVKTHFRKAKKGKSPGESGLAVECFQALIEDEETLTQVHACITDFWRSGRPDGTSQAAAATCFEEWRVGRLKLLPKKGDASDPSNWRGIMLLEAVAKVVGSIIAARLEQLLAVVGVEYQNGFMRRRGCADGVFSLKMALLKRKEHGLGTWTLYVDLVKAFDSVDRPQMFDILLRYGAPEHLVNLIRLLHSDLTVRMSVGEVEVEIPSTVGVKQGDTLAAIIFLFVVQASMETLEPVFEAEGIKKPTFMTKEDDVIAGRKIDEDGGEPFYLWASLYADDGALPFTSRADLELGARLLKEHLLRFALVMHCGTMNPSDGTVAKKSKTEAMFYPPDGYSPTTNDTLFLKIDDALGIVTFTDRFRYLGSTFSSSLTDDDEIEHRIRSAAAAFGCLRRYVFNQNFGSTSLPLASKGKLYRCLVLGILLYGCESWVLTSKLRQRLNTFHNRCVRAMAKKKPPRASSSSDYIFKYAALAPQYVALGLTDIDQYISTRKLRWAGHVMRMSMSRLPRQFMTSWVNAPRGRGPPRLNYGRDLTRELNNVGFNLNGQAVGIGVSQSWGKAAQDKGAWRNLTRLPDVKPIFKKTRSKSPARSSAGALVPPQGGGANAQKSDAQTLTHGATWAQRLRTRR